MPFKKALFWVVFWITLALLFNAGVFLFEGPQKAIDFFTGYLIELSLSVDNLFLFLMVFSAFGVPVQYQRRVLTYGIIGAVIFRLAFILAGASLVEKFQWVLYIFGGLLIVSAFKFIFGGEEKIDLEKNWLTRFVRRFIPVTCEYHEEKFTVRINGRLHMTPLLLVLLIIESTDIMFAIDSIPAIFSITTDPFIVFTSNIFAILGLRSMYFFLERIQRLFIYVKQGVGAILFLTGVKLLLLIFDIHVPTGLALGMIALILTVSVVASLIASRKGKVHPAAHVESWECPLPAQEKEKRV